MTHEPSPYVAASPTPETLQLYRDLFGELATYGKILRQLQRPKRAETILRLSERLSNWCAAAPSPCVTWQPIETAPNGTLLLLCSMLATEARQWCYVDWLVLGQLCGDRSRPAPTHWMPLPSAPSPSAAAQQETP